MNKWTAKVIYVAESKYPYWAMIQYKDQNLYDLESRWKSEETALSYAQDYANIANRNKNTKAQLKPKSLETWKKIRD